MRISAFLLVTAATIGLAQAQTPPATDTGARPGNIIGTGMSLPRSDKAGNIGPTDTHSELAPNLPVPDAPDTLRGLLLAARAELVSNHTGAAQEALERAETRALDRSIPAGTERVPDERRVVSTIAEARQALAVGNIAGAIALVDRALHAP